MKTDLLNLFNDLIYQSLPEEEKAKIPGSPSYHRFYYPNDWEIVERAKTFFDNQPKTLFGTYRTENGSKELAPKNGRRLPFCSCASSARLCYLDFVETHDVRGVVLEVPMPNDFCALAPTWMDAVVLPTCYECKCQEIVNGEGETFRKSYWLHKNSKLFQEFGLSLDKERNVKSHFKDNGELDYEWLDFSCADLKIDLPGQYYELHFNLKQLICHLIAMANSAFSPSPSKLQYVIYVPRIDLIDSHLEMKSLYQSLIHEVDRIWAQGSAISSFAKRHGIELPRPVYKTVDSIQEVTDFESKYR